MDLEERQLRRVIRKLEKREIEEIGEIDSKISDCKIDYNSLLSSEQLNALGSIKGQYLVIAGAGSGKTRTIVYRSAFLLEKGVAPSSILMITFTRKACYEMKERLEKILKKRDLKIRIMTFHSFCARLLYRYRNLFGIRGLKIIDDNKKESIIEEILKEKEIKDFKIDKRPTLEKIISYISKLNISKEKLEDMYDKKQRRYIELIYERFCKYKKEKELFEFDDIIEEVVKKLTVNSCFLDHLRRKINYLIVDEYQDSNLLQRNLLKLLVGSDGNLMVVGDDYQSIYGFRGADFTNILKFGEDFPQAKLIKLETNYRSTDEIIDYTNKIAHKFKLKYQKLAYGTGKKDGKIYKNQFRNEEKQWEYICKKINKFYEDGIPYEEMAVLFRNRYAVKKLEKYLNDFEIPFHRKEENKQSGVSIYSVHGSKGLEWEVVFIPTLLEGVFPSCGTPEELEEEKRLYYVACSRAKKLLFLLYPKFYYEKTGYFDKKSQFLSY